MQRTERRIIVTELDASRLHRVLEQYARGRNAAACEALEDELDVAEVVEPAQVPPDVVTMNSRVRFVDERSGEEHEVTLVYPFAANVDEGRVSILAPIGAALLGLSVGQSIAWVMPDGSTTRQRVVGLPYQPEAAGDFDR
jgi:regulator of nucleoside diphosphate kinase